MSDGAVVPESGPHDQPIDDLARYGAILPNFLDAQRVFEKEDSYNRNNPLEVLAVVSRFLNALERFGVIGEFDTFNADVFQNPDSRRGLRKILPYAKQLRNTLQAGQRKKRGERETVWGDLRTAQEAQREFTTLNRLCPFLEEHLARFKEAADPVSSVSHAVRGALPSVVGAPDAAEGGLALLHALPGYQPDGEPYDIAVAIHAHANSLVNGAKAQAKQVVADAARAVYNVKNAPLHERLVRRALDFLNDENDNGKKRADLEDIALRLARDDRDFASKMNDLLEGRGPGRNPDAIGHTNLNRYLVWHRLEESEDADDVNRLSRLLRRLELKNSLLHLPEAAHGFDALYRYVLEASNAATEDRSLSNLFAVHDVYEDTFEIAEAFTRNAKYRPPLNTENAVYMCDGMIALAGIYAQFIKEIGPELTHDTFDEPLPSDYWQEREEVLASRLEELQALRDRLKPSSNAASAPSTVQPNPARFLENPPSAPAPLPPIEFDNDAPMRRTERALSGLVIDTNPATNDEGIATINAILSCLYDADIMSMYTEAVPDAGMLAPFIADAGVRAQLRRIFNVTTEMLEVFRSLPLEDWSLLSESKRRSYGKLTDFLSVLRDALPDEFELYLDPEPMPSAMPSVSLPTEAPRPISRTPEAAAIALYNLFFSRDPITPEQVGHDVSAIERCLQDSGLRESLDTDHVFFRQCALNPFARGQLQSLHDGALQMLDVFDHRMTAAQREPVMAIHWAEIATVRRLLGLIGEELIATFPAFSSPAVPPLPVPPPPIASAPAPAAPRPRTPENFADDLRTLIFDAYPATPQHVLNGVMAIFNCFDHNRIPDSFNDADSFIPDCIANPDARRELESLHRDASVMLRAFDGMSGTEQDVVTATYSYQLHEVRRLLGLIQNALNPAPTPFIPPAPVPVSPPPPVVSPIPPAPVAAPAPITPPAPRPAPVAPMLARSPHTFVRTPVVDPVNRLDASSAVKLDEAKVTARIDKMVTSKRHNMGSLFHLIARQNRAKKP